MHLFSWPLNSTKFNDNDAFYCILYDLPASVYPFLPFPNISWESKQTACLFSASTMRTTNCKTIHPCNYERWCTRKLENESESKRDLQSLLRAMAFLCMIQLKGFNYWRLELPLGCKFLSQRKCFINKQGGKLNKVDATLVRCQLCSKLAWRLYLTNYLILFIASGKTYYTIAHEIRISLMFPSVD